jgi:anti-sigma B factor antagonist
MTLRIHPVTVKQFPEKLSANQERLFLRELEAGMSVDRPRIVLDCSEAREMDCSALHLLLCCLEAAMKRNGDLKLSVVSEGALAKLQLVGMDRLFEVFETTAAAVNSFRRLPVDGSSDVRLSASFSRPSENAA